MKKLLTFEREKRNEFIYVLYNAVFVCACIVFVLYFAVSFFSDALALPAVADNLLRRLLNAVALILPFAILGKRQEQTIKKLFTTGKVSPKWFIFGSTCVVGLTIFTAYLSAYPVELLENAGYVIHEPLLGVSGTSGNILSAVFCAVFSAFAGELCFRGVLADKLRRVNTAAALILPALIAACLTGSLMKLPYILVSGIVLSWLYMKTSSIYVTLTAALLRDLALNGLYYIKEAMPTEVESFANLIIVLSAVVGIASLILLFINFGIKTEYPAPRDSDDEYSRMSGKEALGGVLRSFAFWIFIFATVFTVFFNYLSNPNIPAP